MKTRNTARFALAAAGAFAVSPASAAQFSLDVGEGLTGTLNSSITAGGAVRMQDRDSRLIGKSNLDPSVCSGRYQSCQGLFLDQIYPSQRLVAAPGQLGMRADDGDLSYDRHELISGISKITQDLTLNYGEFGLFARWLYFYDFVNNDFRQNAPNLLTAENAGRTGITGSPESNRYFARVYGPGEHLSVPRNDGETLRQIGTDFQLLDLNVFGKIPLPGDKNLTLKVGRQTVNWGESTLVVINSVNQANSINANNLFRTGFAVEEVFTPLGMVFGSMEVIDNLTAEGFYQYEWQPLEAPAPGSFFSFVDVGTNNVRDWVNLSFGSSADDPDKVGHPLDNPLTLITPTTAHIGRKPDHEARDGGQFGAALKYYAEGLNGGTELSAYYMHYHSRLPYVSFYSTNPSCARREGNAAGIDAHDLGTFVAACPNTPGFADPRARQQELTDIAATIARNPAILQDLGTDPASLAAAANAANPNAPLSDAVPLDTGFIQLEYPEDIDMFGASFNTTVGSWAMQGEVSYRPKLPLQVAISDLSFAAAGPTLSRCHDRALHCAGSHGGSGYNADGTFAYNNYGSSDFVDASGNNPYPDTINLVLGALPGSARSFPNFIIPYRGGVIGENPPNSYIRGWETFQVFQYDLGFTKVLGATDNWIGADQVALILEFGVVHIPDLPPLDQLQIEGPGIFTSATAGADGSGADGSRQACSTNPTCSVGPDGGRFNPHQADLNAFVDKFSAGYRVIARISYESVFPGISFQPLIILAHDVKGTSPGPAENFVEGRKSAITTVEMRYHDALAFDVGYTWFWGAGEHNLLRDRDYAQFFAKYQF